MTFSSPAISAGSAVQHSQANANSQSQFLHFFRLSLLKYWLIRFQPQNHLPASWTPCEPNCLWTSVGTYNAESCKFITYDWYCTHCFQTAVVKPLLKNTHRDPGTLNNYRPVFSLPFFSKGLKRVVSQHLLVHLINNNVWYVYGTFLVCIQGLSFH